MGCAEVSRSFLLGVGRWRMCCTTAKGVWLEEWAARCDRHVEQLLPAIVHSTAPTLIEYCGGPMSKKWGYPASAKKGRKRTAAQVLKGLFFSLFGVSGRDAFGNGAPRVDRLEDYVP